MDPLLLAVQLLSHVWLCDLMNCSTPDFPVFHYLPEFAQIHAHCVSDATQISHPVAPCSSFPLFFPAWGSFLMSWIFASGGQNIGTSASALILPMNIHSRFPLGLTNLIFLLSKGLSRVFSSTTVWKRQFFGSQSSLWSNSHIHTWLLEKPLLWLYGHLSAKWCLCFLIHCLSLS